MSEITTTIDFDKVDGLVPGTFKSSSTLARLMSIRAPGAGAVTEVLGAPFVSRPDIAP
jgi:hypothetical protein